MAKIVLATSLLWREPISDAPLREALAQSGHTCISVPWNGDDQSAFLTADLVLLRSCWDYFKAPRAFLEWLASLETVQVRNPLALVRWNFDKSYLIELRAAGFNVPETKLVNPKDHDQVQSVMKQQGWHRAVRKPVSGQSGHFVDVLDLANRRDWPESLMPTEHALLQPFLTDVQQLGETLLYFFKGQFAYAVQRLPKPQHGRDRIEISVSDEVIRQAEEILAFLDDMPLYARIDGLMQNNTFLLMELELIEPSFAFEAAPDKAIEFVRAIEDELGELGGA
ncbi:ATP-grasp domain-containing protein [Yoonia sp. 2307UL14-13]|uniref:ATP-grasp domain-containing protein n=1 Tax=Yoonia sp. 2307UL14-13 TaxID=3126506 RepID=UPI0030A8D865